MPRSFCRVRATKLTRETTRLKVSRSKRAQSQGEEEVAKLHSAMLATKLFSYVRFDISIAGPGLKKISFRRAPRTGGGHQKVATG